MTTEKEIYNELCRLGWLTIPYLQRKFKMSHSTAASALLTLEDKYELDSKSSKNLLFAIVTKIEIPTSNVKKFKRFKKLI
jgi:hypothetical protein